MAPIDWKNPDFTEVYQDRVDRLKRMRAPDFDLDALKEYYRTHPADWINDFGMTFDPRMLELDKPAIMPFVLFPEQRKFIDWLYESWRGRHDGVVEKSRDAGASWLCVAFAVWMWIFYPGSVFGFGSRKEEYVDKLGDTKTIFWKIRAFIGFLPAEFKPKGYVENKHALFMRIVNPENEATIIGEAGDAIGRGARTSIYVVDESAFVERQESVDAALSQTSNCKIHVSTPNGVGNLFYRKRHKPGARVFVFDWRNDPRKGPEWYAKQKNDLDPVVLAQEVDRDYSASVANSYIAGRLVTAASMRGPADVVAYGPLMIGVDVARFGNDKSVITLRKGRVCLRQTGFGKVDTVDCAGRVLDICRALQEMPGQIAVDTCGLGAGVADMLRRDPKFGHLVVDVNSGIQLDDGQNYNLRARMWRDMLEWIKTASIPNEQDLTTDLSALQYYYKGGLLLIESKDDAKKRGIKSPDWADSLALTFAYPPEDRRMELPEANIVNPIWQALDTVTNY